MAEETSAPPPAPVRRRQYLSHDLVLEILLHLPIESLLRFACVSKTWHDTITSDPCFRRRHFLLQDPGVLIRPRVRSYAAGHPPRYTTPGLYRWERKSQPDTATLVQAMTDSVPEDEAWRHKLAHCDGLVLVATSGCGVRLLNPATRRVLTLPPTVSPCWRTWPFVGAFGLGHDPRSGAYKVARFFYHGGLLFTGVYPYNLRMEVLSIGIDQQWRETVLPPPYPVFAGQTATFFKGSLLWMINQSLILPRGSVSMRGFLRFNLEDESFSVMSAPSGCPELWYSTYNLAEIRGELCLAHLGPPATSQSSHRKVSIWACDGIIPPRWVLRHVVEAPSCIHMIAASDTDGDGVMFQKGSCILECSDSRRIQEGVTSLARMGHLKYHYPNKSKLVEYKEEVVHGYDVIPYIPSLVPI